VTTTVAGTPQSRLVISATAVSAVRAKAHQANNQNKL